MEESKEEPGDVKFDDFYRPTHHFFKVVGIDFDVGERTSVRAKIRRIAMNSYAVYGIFCLITMCVNRAAQMPMIIQEGFNEIIMSLFNIIPLPVSAFQTCFFMSHKRELTEIVDILRNLFPKLRSEQERYGIAGMHRSAVRFVKFYIGITTLLMSAFSLSTLVKIMNDGIRINEDLWLPAFVDRTNPYIFAVVEPSLYWVTFGCVIPQCASNLIIGVLVSALSIQFEILRSDIREALNRPETKLSDFRTLIAQHNQLIDISNRLRRLFSLILILEFIQSSVIICLTSAQLLFLHGVEFIAFTINFLFSFIHYYVPFYYGQKLYDSSQIIVDAVTGSSWFNVKDREVRLALVPMIQNAQNARILTGSDFVVVYRKTYRKVLMTSYSFFSLLMHFYEQ